LHTPDEHYIQIDASRSTCLKILQGFLFLRQIELCADLLEDGFGFAEMNDIS
jgi:hypothetical protein